MDESAIKGLKLLELNDSVRKTGCSSISTTISIEGYDNTSLQGYPIRLMLTKHFSSCGKIKNVYVPRDDLGIPKSAAFMRIEGEGAEEKALGLSGTDVGGWTAVVKAAPWVKVFADRWCPAFAGAEEHQLRVRGYDTSRPAFDIRMALCKHFSSCGEVMLIMLLHCGTAIIHLMGERCADKALELSGRNVGGMTLVVEPVGADQPESDSESECLNGARRRTRYRAPIGYTHPPMGLAEKKKKKKKMEMEMEKEKTLS